MPTAPHRMHNPSPRPFGVLYAVFVLSLDVDSRGAVKSSEQQLQKPSRTKSGVPSPIAYRFIFQPHWRNRYLLYGHMAALLLGVASIHPPIEAGFRSCSLPTLGRYLLLRYSIFISFLTYPSTGDLPCPELVLALTYNPYLLHSFNI